MASRKNSSPTKQPRRMHVVPVDGGWAVRSASAGRVTSIHATQAEATKAAQSSLRRSGGQLSIQGRNGRLHESLTLGRDSMAKISAVEGIHLSTQMQRTLKGLDSAGVSGEERRRAIAHEFGKKKP